MQVELQKEFHFEAAHSLSQVPDGHKCKGFHGHSYCVIVAVAGETDPKMGWYIDFDEIVKAFKPLQKQLDHKYLNDIPGLENSTSEMLAKWIWDRLIQNLPGLVSVTVKETATSTCIYRGK